MKIKIRIILLCVGSYIAPVLGMEDQKVIYLSCLESIQAKEEYVLKIFIEDRSKNIPIHTLIEQNNVELQSLKKEIKKKKNDVMRGFRDIYPLTQEC